MGRDSQCLKSIGVSGNRKLLREGESLFFMGNGHWKIVCATSYTCGACVAINWTQCFGLVLFGFVWFGLVWFGLVCVLNRAWS